MQKQKQQGFISTTMILIIIGVLIVGGGIGYIIYSDFSFTGCTKEAKICPDGSSVGRIPPTCEFAKCSDINTGNRIENSIKSSIKKATNPTVNWKTYRNEKYGFEFKYPRDVFVRSEDGSELSHLSISEFYKNNEMVFNVRKFLSPADNISFLEIVKKYGGNSISEGFCGYDPIQEIKTENGGVGYHSSWYCCGRGCGAKSVNGHYAYFENPHFKRSVNKGVSPRGFFIRFQPPFVSEGKIINQILSTFKFID